MFDNPFSFTVGGIGFFVESMLSVCVSVSVSLIARHGAKVFTNFHYSPGNGVGVNKDG